jgi:hypothetical protein
MKRRYDVGGLAVSMMLALVPFTASAEVLPTIEETCPGSIGYGTRNAEVMVTIHMDTVCPYEINLYTPEANTRLAEVTTSYKKRAYTIHVPQDSFVQVRGLGTGPNGGGVHRITLQVDPVVASDPKGR